MIHSRLATLVVVLLVVSARAQERQDVTFSINQTTAFGQSVFVLGDLPELGGGDIRFAVKLEPTTYPIWKTTISLPVNRAYTYRYYIRNDAAGQWGSSSNATPLGTGLIAATTSTIALEPDSKTVFVHSMFDPPTLWWRERGSNAAYQAIVMHEVGPGRAPAEKRYAGRRFSQPRRHIEFFFSNASFTQFDPADSSNYSTALDRVFIQDAHAFSYLPPTFITGPIKRYTVSGGVPTTPSTSLFSAALNETRRYRVITPRGYDQNASRRYPVIYFHDGQNMFEQGTFGTWNADETAERMTRQGLLREAILVGADHGPNRLNDYAAPDNGGRANLYAQFLMSELKPVIDAQYRTLTSANDTIAAGSSMGGQVSMYLGWDFPTVFARVGVFSSAWDVFNANFRNRIRNQPKRDIRIYMDSGDSGTASDNFWPTLGVRDDLINPARTGSLPYILERDLRWTYGPFQQHNEPAWAARLPGALEFLLPASEAPDELAALPSARPADVNDDDGVTIEDLYAFEQSSPGEDSTLDVNRDSMIDADSDRAALRAILRAAEPADTISPL